MIYFLFFCLGGLIGIIVRHYCGHFATQLTDEIYQSYCEVFPHNKPLNKPQYSLIQPIKCGSNLSCFLAFGGIYLALYWWFKEPFFAAIVAFKCSLLFVISLIDYHYKLIPISLCQQLIGLGLLASCQPFLLINLESSLISGSIGFMAFWLLYHFAKFYYRTEALGRGDYWLIGGLATFHPWQALPQLIFTACIAALLYFSWLKMRQQSVKFIPFAPFLCFGGFVTFGVKLLT